MRNILALLLFAFTTSLLFAQSNYQDVVYLKNGSIIRGIIIEQVPNKSIKIETVDRNVFVYQIDEIEKFTKEPYQDKSANPLNSKGLQSGQISIVELGYQIGVGHFGLDRLKLNIINGYQINPHFSLGFGTGLRYYLDAKAALFPVFADLRSTFVYDEVLPYLSLGLGYSFDATNNFEGVGFLLNPRLGLSFKVADKYALNFGLGYEMQRMKFFHSNWHYDKFTKNSGAISITVGTSFLLPKETRP